MSLQGNASPVTSCGRAAARPRAGPAESPPAPGGPGAQRGPRHVLHAAPQNACVRRAPRGHRVQPLCFSDRETEAQGSCPGLKAKQRQSQDQDPGPEPEVSSRGGVWEDGWKSRPKQGRTWTEARGTGWPGLLLQAWRPHRHQYPCASPRPGHGSASWPPSPLSRRREGRRTRTASSEAQWTWWPRRRGSGEGRGPLARVVVIPTASGRLLGQEGSICPRAGDRLLSPCKAECCQSPGVTDPRVGGGREDRMTPVMRGGLAGSGGHRQLEGWGLLEGSR